MARTKLPPKWIVTLLGNIGGYHYSIVPPGREFGDCWTICHYKATGVFTCIESPIAHGSTVIKAMQEAFHCLRNTEPGEHPNWNPDNWRKGKYVGP